MNIDNLKIEFCPYWGCQYKCCNFDLGNYILLFPGELDDAKKKNKSLSHLTILETDSFNGNKAICTATQRKNCDYGYKPLDCLFYPYFPKEIGESTITMLKGIKCPLETRQIVDHLSFVCRETKKLIKKNERVNEWLKIVKLVGYETLTFYKEQNGCDPNFFGL